MNYTDRQRKVEALLHIRFPKSWVPPPLGTDASIRDDHRQMMDAIETARRALVQLSDVELDAAHEAAQSEARRRKELLAELAEKGRYFNHRDADANFSYWAKAEYWTFDESVSLLLGKAPECVNWQGIEPYVGTSAFAKRYADLRRLGLRSEAMGRGQRALRPAVVMRWAATIDHEVPLELAAALARRPGTASSSMAMEGLPVTPSELAEASLRRFENSLDGLAAFNGFDPASTPLRDALIRKYGSAVVADSLIAEQARRQMDWASSEEGKGESTPPAADEADESTAEDTSESGGSCWHLKKPLRDDGLAGAIYRVLKSAQDSGADRPTARDVLEAFRESKPPGVLRVVSDSCDYLDNRGDEQSADLKNIRKRIGELTKPRDSDRTGKSRPSAA